MKQNRWAKQTGFTIVELLIVIVVIAILAAISIVAYNGIQKRAENTKTTTAVVSYKKAIDLYYIDKGEYPTTGAMCLGDDYPVLDGTTEACRYSTSPIATTLNAADRDLLKPYLSSSLPMPSTKFLRNSGTKYVGIYFYGSASNLTLDGSPVVALTYTIEDTTCPIGPVYRGNGWPNLTSTSVVRTSTINPDSSICMLLLPNK